MRAEGDPRKHMCWWCDAPAIEWKLTHRSVVKKKDGVPKVIDAAEFAPVCALHAVRLLDTEDPAVVRGRNANMSKRWKKLQEGMF